MAQSLSADPLDILAAHNEWATRDLLRRCGPLSAEEFHRRFPIGLGSLHDNLTHIISAMRRWADRISERPLREAVISMPGSPPTADQRPRTPDELLALLDEAAPEIRAVAAASRARGLDSRISVVWPVGGQTRTYTFTRGAALTHLFTHGHWHRAQCINMLRHLNLPGHSENLPDLSVVDWQAETESPPVIS